VRGEAAHYITVDASLITIVDTDAIRMADSASGLLLEYIEVHGGWLQGILQKENAGPLTVRHANLHHNGHGVGDHGVYVSGIIGTNVLQDITASFNTGYGIHVHRTNFTGTRITCEIDGFESFSNVTGGVTIGHMNSSSFVINGNVHDNGTSGWDGFFILQCDGVLFEDIDSSDNARSGYWLSNAGGGNDNLVFNCCTGTGNPSGKIVNEGSASTFEDNPC
jgi:hypothetical protein